ncbi:MAG: septum formation initiator family protein [Lentisphaeria bacterium]|jgi:cell division protein FtsB|nr:septum formation initiator family protein [Lentisphaeria bacterium]
MKPRHVILALLFFAAIGGSVYFLGRLYVDNRTLQEKLRVVDQDVRQQQREIRDLRALLEALQNDPRTVERIAREHLRMSRENETIYTFSNPDPQPRPAEAGDGVPRVAPERTQP